MNNQISNNQILNNQINMLNIALQITQVRKDAL